MKVLTKISYFHCSPLWKMDNNVADINVAYDKWILRASGASLGLCLCEKPMRWLGGDRGSACALWPSRAVNQCSGLHQWCQRSGHNTSRWAAREPLPSLMNSAQVEQSVPIERIPMVECLPMCMCWFLGFKMSWKDLEKNTTIGEDAVLYEEIEICNDANSEKWIRSSL